MGYNYLPSEKLTLILTRKKGYDTVKSLNQMTSHAYFTQIAAVFTEAYKQAGKLRLNGSDLKNFPQIVRYFPQYLIRDSSTSQP